MVIGDIHYIYSLSPLLGTAMNNDGGRWTVLLDEAHNLPQRARDMFSASLLRSRLMKVKRGTGGAVAKTLAAINRKFLALEKTDWQEEGFHSIRNYPNRFCKACASWSKW